MKSYLRKHLQAYTVYQSARQEFSEQGKEMILLDANENPFDWPYNRYPDPMQTELKASISRWRGVAVDQIYLGNGSDEIINQLIQAFCEPGEDKILICPPTFGMYSVSANLFQIETLEVPLTSDFQLDLPAIQSQDLSQIKLCFVPNPNNPTGNRFSKEALQTLAKWIPGILVVDEAYAEFSPEASALSWCEAFPNVVVLQTFSKAQGMAGVRLGMGFGPESIIEGLLKVKAPYNINALTMAAVQEQVETQQDRVADMVSQLTAERKRVVAAVSEIPFVETVFPSDANFFMIRVDDSHLRYQQLLELGIVVRNASKNIKCENCLRITVGTEKENNQFIDALRTMVNR